MHFGKSAAAAACAAISPPNCFGFNGFRVVSGWIMGMAIPLIKSDSGGDALNELAAHWYVVVIDEVVGSLRKVSIRNHICRVAHSK